MRLRHIFDTCTILTIVLIDIAFARRCGEIDDSRDGLSYYRVVSCRPLVRLGLFELTYFLLFLFNLSLSQRQKLLIAYIAKGNFEI